MKRQIHALKYSAVTGRICFGEAAESKSILPGTQGLNKKDLAERLRCVNTQLKEMNELLWLFLDGPLHCPRGCVSASALHLAGCAAPRHGATASRIHTRSCSRAAAFAGS